MRALLTLATISALLAPATALSAQAAGSTHLMVVTGLSGEPRIGTQWHGMAMALLAAASERYAIPTANVIVLAEDSTRDAPRVTGRSTKATIERTLAALARSLTAADRLLVIVIAHGSSLSGEARVNLPGPDMTSSDFARVLAAATQPTIAFVQTGSASGDFATALAGPRRIVITATKSAREQNETIFPGPFVRALTTDAGDTDKDGRVSLLEAFTYAQHEVEQVFTQGNLLATEHALLNDGADGGRARSFQLATSSSSGAAGAVAQVALAAVQARIDALRARRATLSEDAYLEVLEPLMVELAQRMRALRANSGVVKP
jgi:hypothetical protein